MVTLIRLVRGPKLSVNISNERVSISKHYTIMTAEIYCQAQPLGLFLPIQPRFWVSEVETKGVLYIGRQAMRKQDEFQIDKHETGN